MSSPVFEPTPTPQIVAEDAVSAVTDSGRDAPFEQDDRPKVGAGYIWLMVLAQFGIFLGLVAAIGYSLSVKVAQISPDNTDLLGVVVGLGATALVLVGPVLGMLSDRTRTRIGRRRPWLIAAVPLGIVGFVVVALAPSIWVMVIGWIIVQLGFGTSLAMLANSMADRLPASQRGKVAGLAGVAQMGASIIGVAVASMFTSSSLLLFLVPAGVGAVLALLFVVFIGEDDTRQLQHVESLSPRLILSKYIFDVKKYRDFSWNFLGRFLFNFGLTMSTTFTTFFFADKLGISVAEIGGIVAISGLVSIVATMGGAGFSGFLSDRLRRRRVFVFLAGILFAVGTVVMVFAPGLPVLLVGTFISSLGLGIFSAVDQALVLDVLPERDTQAGRYNAINQFSTTVPQAAAPLVAPVLLLVGGGSNYPVLFVASAVFALIGGLVILLRVKSVR